MTMNASTPNAGHAKAIKMVVTDLDGTLLRKDKSVSAYTASVFQRSIDAGIKVIFATARPIRAVKALGLPFCCDACVCHNGAIATLDDQRFLEVGIPHDVAMALLDTAGRLPGMRVAVEANDTLYANFDAKEAWPGIQSIRTDFSDLPKCPVDKILFITAERGIMSQIEGLLSDSLYMEISENTVLMVMNKHARKQKAVSALAERYGLSLQEIAAFGDDYNDIEMLRACGTGVAVANAIDEVKEVADFICRSNEEDGVAKWIEENVL